MLVHWIILANHLIDKLLNLTKFLIGNLLEVRNVETEGVWTYIRTLLLCMFTENLLQSIVEEVGCSMVGS